jgi:hypothetical protein
MLTPKFDWEVQRAGSFHCGLACLAQNPKLLLGRLRKPVDYKMLIYSLLYRFSQLRNLG